MKKERIVTLILRAVSNYLTFFLLVAFVITCCTMLFVSTLSSTLGLNLTGENLSAAAKLTFLNVILLSLIFSLIDALRRHFTVKRPVKHITEAAEKITQGDFSVRISPVSRFGSDETFNRIIDCFNKIAQELGSVETLRSDFISNVSHEMKTPLAVIQNYAAMLQQPGLTEEQRMDYARCVGRSSRRLSDMMSNILRLSRLENQQIFPEKSRFDLGEQLCGCLLQFESVWEERKIALETDIEEDLYVIADRELLSLVWSNLFSNAFKFTPSGGKVSVSLRSSGSQALVCVSDTGCGMSAEVGAHIFEKFYQGDSSHATEGNGLGLALVKRVVDILGARISVESAPNHGSSFTVALQRL